MPKTRGKKIAAALTVLLLALVGFRLYLPTLVLHQVNKRLALLEGYDGHVERIGLSLWRGEYRIYGLRVEKTGGALPVPFFSAPATGVSLEWRDLLRGRIVAEIWMRGPKLNLVKGPKEGELAAEPNESLAAAMKSMSPVAVNRVTIRDGQIHYRDFSSDPKIDLALTDIEASARNLRNTKGKGSALPADIRISAKAFETGTLTVSLRAAPLMEDPTFELKQTLTGVELVKLNDLFDAYAKVKVKSGVFGLSAEVAAKDGKFIGYAKPFLKDVVLDKKAGGNVGKQLWAAAVSSVKWLFSNKSENELAGKIPIEGTFEKAKVGVWAAVGSTLKNAYIKALTPRLEGVGLKDVGKVKKP